MGKAIRGILGLVLLWLGLSYWFPAVLFGNDIEALGPILVFLIAVILVLMHVKWDFDVILGGVLLLISVVQFIGLTNVDSPFNFGLSANILAGVVGALGLACLFSAFSFGNKPIQASATSP